MIETDRRSWGGSYLSWGGSYFLFLGFGVMLSVLQGVSGEFVYLGKGTSTRTYYKVMVLQQMEGSNRCLRWVSYGLLGTVWKNFKWNQAQYNSL